MAFLTGHRPQRCRRQVLPARTTEAWRIAAATVWARWDAFLATPDEGRQVAFAAYVAALDAECAAADEMAGAGMSTAADTDPRLPARKSAHVSQNK
jgi:hypothetical protein